MKKSPRNEKRAKRPPDTPIRKCVIDPGSGLTKKWRQGYIRRCSRAFQRRDPRTSKAACDEMAESGILDFRLAVRILGFLHLSPEPLETRMIQILRCLMLAISSLILPCCVSAIIADSGKSYSHLESPEVTVHQARTELGEPTFTVKYQPPMRISDTKLYRARAEEFPGHPPRVHARGRKSSSVRAENLHASLCEVYNPKGWISEEDVTVYGMAAGILPVIGDLYMLPSALSEKQRLMQQGKMITLWYDEKGRYVAHYDGDISAARKKSDSRE